MDTVDTRAATHGTATSLLIQWGPVIAGAIVGSALAFVLMTFAAALGLSVASASPTWRDASAALALLSGIFLILVALLTFGLGGYVAGRLRTPWAPATADEVEFRDGMHGALVWGVAILITGVLAAATAGLTGARLVPTATSPSATTAEPLVAFELDRLFRSDRRPANADLTYDRAEASRIIAAAASRTGITGEDRAYLVRLVIARTGLAPAEAERRVDEILAAGRRAISRARRVTVIIGFMSAAAMVLGAVAAWLGACAGGRHRDGAPVPTIDWRWPRVARPVPPPS
jgi:hypothetical protein